MDIYAQKNRWKLVLAIIGIIIIGISLFYTNYVVERIATQESKRAEQTSLVLSRKRNKRIET